MALKEDNNVFHRMFKELNVLFDKANQKIASILLLQISLGTVYVENLAVTLIWRFDEFQSIPPN